MRGFGDRYYWGRSEMGGKIEGIVVLFTWMLSQERHLKSYVQLYSSLVGVSMQAVINRPPIVITVNCLIA